MRNEVRQAVVRRRPRVGRDAGASMAEFAIIAPVLIMLLFGAVEFGIAFNRAQAVEAAAREGARLASLQTTTVGDIDARVTEALAGIPITADPPVVSPGVCSGRAGQTVQVVVTADHPINIPLLSIPPVQLRGQAVFRCEG